MKQFPLKKVVLTAIALIISVFTVAGPAFPLVSMFGFSTSGYDLIDYISQISLLGTEAQISLGATFFMMIFGIIAFCLAVASFFIKDSKKAADQRRGVIGLGCIGAVLYTVGGALYGESYTLAFVPLILIVVFTVAYIVCSKMLKDDEPATPANTTNAAPAASETPASRAAEESDTIELLEKYKKLLDDGVITQEEFDEKKSKLL